MDRLSKEERSENMRRIRSSNTKPEIVVRRIVHGLGYRYSLRRSDLPGKPDLAFPARRKVIFVHGCFWHQHRSTDCPIVRKPKSNRAYWNAKLARNVERDKENARALHKLGWRYMTLWECETRKPARLASKICRFLNDD